MWGLCLGAQVGAPEATSSQALGGASVSCPQLLHVDVSTLNLASNHLDWAVAISFSPGDSDHLLVSTSSNKVVVLDAVSGHTIRKVSHGTTGSWPADPFLFLQPCPCAHCATTKGRLRECFSSFPVSAPEPAPPWLLVRMLVCCWQPLAGPLQCGIIQHRRTPAARYVLRAPHRWLRRLLEDQVKEGRS